MYQKIQEIADEVCAALLTKGVISPRIQFEIESGKTSITMWLWWKEDETSGTKSELIWASDFEIARVKAYDFINKMPSKDERQRAEYRIAVARAIEIGKKYQIEDAAINPLREVMEKLSKNVLEHHPVTDLDDDIPF